MKYANYKITLLSSILISSLIFAACSKKEEQQAATTNTASKTSLELTQANLTTNLESDSNLDFISLLPIGAFGYQLWDLTGSNAEKGLTAFLAKNITKLDSSYPASVTTSTAVSKSQEQISNVSTSLKALLNSGLLPAQGKKGQLDNLGFFVEKNPKSDPSDTQDDIVLTVVGRSKNDISSSSAISSIINTFKNQGATSSEITENDVKLTELKYKIEQDAEESNTNDGAATDRKEPVKEEYKNVYIANPKNAIVISSSKIEAANISKKVSAPTVETNTSHHLYQESLRARKYLTKDKNNEQGFGLIDIVPFLNPVKTGVATADFALKGLGTNIDLEEVKKFANSAPLSSISFNTSIDNIDNSKTSVLFLTPTVANDYSKMFLSFFSSLTGKNTMQNLPKDSAIALGIDGSIIEKAATLIGEKHNEEGKPQDKANLDKMLDVAKNITSLGLGISAANAGAMFPNLSFVIDSKNSKALVDIIKSSSSDKAQESGIGAGMTWNTKDIAGVKSAFMTSPFGVGIFIADLADAASANGKVVVSISEQALASTLEEIKKAPQTEAKQAETNVGVAPTTASPPIAYSVNLKKIAEIIEGLTSSFAMFTGGKSPFPEEQLEMLKKGGTITGEVKAVGNDAVVLNQVGTL